MKYKKKPIVIEALLFGPATSYRQIVDWVGPSHCCICPDQDGLYIRTLEGTMTCSRGDYVIKGISGEFYPCKPDIFEKTYESVDD